MSSAKRQILVNIIFTVIKTLFMLYSIRLATNLLEASIMGTILLIRRQAPMFANVTHLGLSQSLLKYVASSSNIKNKAIIFTDVLKFIFLSIFICFAIGYVFSGEVAYYVLGVKDVEFGHYFVLYVVGYMLNYVAYASWFAKLDLIKANLVELINVGLLFILVLVLFGENGTTIDLLKPLSLLTCLFSVLFLIWFYIKELSKEANLIISHFFSFNLNYHLLHYGFLRGVGAFAETSIFVVGPWLLRHKADEAGYLIIALSVIKMFQVAVTPISQVMSIRAISFFHQSNDESKKLLFMTLIITVLSLVAVVFYFIVGKILLELWIPGSADEVEFYINYLIFGLPAICGFYMLRNYVDLVFRIPYNLIFLSISLVVFLFIQFISEKYGIVIELSVIYGLISVFVAFYLYTIIVCFKLKKNC